MELKAKRHEEAIQNLEVQHAQHMNAALQEKSKAEVALANAKRQLADALAENEVLIQQKQHPKARAFHVLEQRIAEIEGKYRAREAELQSIIAQSAEAREAEREMEVRRRQQRCSGNVVTFLMLSCPHLHCRHVNSPRSFRKRTNKSGYLG